MHNYMYARIKFHTYRDFISELISTVSRKGEKQQLKDYKSLQLILETETPNFTGNRLGLRTPRTQQHIQKTSPQLSPSEQQ